MPQETDQVKVRGLQHELHVEQPANIEHSEPTQADLENLRRQIDALIGDEEVRVLKNANERIHGAPASLKLDQKKADSIFAVSGFADRTQRVRDRISALAKSTKNKIKGLVSTQSVDFNNLTQPETLAEPQIESDIDIAVRETTDDKEYKKSKETGFSLLMTRQELDEALADDATSSQKLVTLFKKDFSKQLATDTGVKERESLEKHLVIGLGQIDRYFRDKTLPGNVSDGFLKVVEMFHDIGKPEAAKHGRKDAQHEYTLGIMIPAMEQLGFDEKQIRLATALVNGDPIGQHLKNSSPTLSAKEALDMANESGIPVEDFWKLLNIFYKIDASSYSTDVGGIGSTDYAFQFDHNQGNLNYSTRGQELVSQIKVAMDELVTSGYQPQPLNHEQIPSTLLEIGPAEPAQENPEMKELKSYLEKEVYEKFHLTREDEERALAEAPERRREILRRSFENARGSLATFYKMTTVDSRVDSYAVDRANKQLTYKTLYPILEDSLEEIRPRLAELGLEVTPTTLGFTPETATQEGLSSALDDSERIISAQVKNKTRGKIVEALRQNGVWQGITVPTPEQLKDDAYMEERGEHLGRLESEAIRQAIEVTGLSLWYRKTKEKLDEPYTAGPGRSTGDIQTVDSDQFKIKKSKEEVTAMLETEKNQAERTNFLCVNIDANKFEKVLAQGGFRDIFSLNAVELEEMNHVVGRGDNFYMNQRTTIEQALGTYDLDKPTVYGTYASENGTDEQKGGANMYGGIFLKIKPNTETVFCEGDSMSGGNDIATTKLSERNIYSSTHWVEAAQARQIAPEHAALVKGMNNAYKKIEDQFGRGVSSFSYLEAHIKGLNLDDVDSINIPENYVTGLSRGTVEQGDYQALIEKLQNNPRWKDKINIIPDA